MEFLLRKKILHLLAAVLISFLLILMLIKFSKELKRPSASKPSIEVTLPSPAYTSHVSIEETLKKRRSVRQYQNKAITLEQVAQLLWASQGVTSNNGFRTAPSAGALYPLEIYLVSGNIDNLPAGIYHYLPEKHRLQKVKEDDVRNQLSQAALGQKAIQFGAVAMVITAEFSRTMKKYGHQGREFVFMEAGHAAQNIYLQSVSLNLGTVSIGAFDKDQVKAILGINEEPLYILPIGAI
jgi:SagB-type dehydrogenase family enzyme